jgi:hypothetical protein
MLQKHERTNTASSKPSAYCNIDSFKSGKPEDIVAPTTPMITTQEKHSLQNMPWELRTYCKSLFKEIGIRAESHFCSTRKVEGNRRET